MVPEWWGITTVCVNGSAGFTATRKPRPNAAVDPETLVRLLWRDEVMTALIQLGNQPDPRGSRSSLWEERLRAATLLGRLPTLDEVASVAAFVASDRASAMTGAIVNITCGSLVD
jgi:NAD(P)-dependent dehydrogenase (short-subunit alcohol dehydrogenase family)